MPILIFLSKNLEYKLSDMANKCDIQLQRSSYKALWIIFLSLLMGNGPYCYQGTSSISFLPAKGTFAALYTVNFFYFSEKNSAHAAKHFQVFYKSN